MKNRILALAVSLTPIVQGQAQRLPDLPEAFRDMTAEDPFPGLVPAAVYRFKDNKVSFACVGTLYRSCTNSWDIIVPEHLFSLKEKNPDYSYVVRIARPDSHHIDGFIGKVKMRSKNIYGCDIAIAAVSSNAAPVKGFSSLGDAKVVIAYAETVI